MTIEELRVLITAETQGLDRQIRNVQGQLGRLSNSVERTNSKISQSFKSLFKGFTVAAIIAGVVKLGKEAINLASQLEEVQNVVDVSFGSMSAEVDKFAKQALKSFGMSELSAKRMSSTFMAMSNGMGIFATDGKNMSLQLTKLAGDMASFYNVSHDVAETALKSVFTGETESLKKFGVVMTQANLQAYALSQGITKSYSAMSQAEQVMLRYNFVMNATSKAQGDFARTSGGWANQVRILKEQFSQLLGILGKGLIAALTPALQVLNKVLGYLISIANAIAKVFGGKKTASTNTAITDASNAAGGLSDNIGDAEDGLDGANGAAKKLQKTLGSFDELNIMASQDTGGGSGGKGSGGGGIGGGGGNIEAVTMDEEEEVDGMASGIEKAMERIKAALDSLKPVWDAFTKAFDTDYVIDSFNGLKDTVVEFAKEFVDGLDFSKYIPALTNFADAAGSAMSTVIGGLLDSLRVVIETFWPAMIPVWQEFINNTIPMLIDIAAEVVRNFEAIFKAAKQIFDTVISSLKPLADFIGLVLTEMQQVFNAWWYESMQPVFEKFREVVAKIGETISHFWNDIVAPVIKKIADVLTELWNNHLKPLVANVLGLISDFTNMILEFWNNVLLPFVNWFIDTFGPYIVAVWNTIVEVVGHVIGIIVDIVNGLVTMLRGVITFLTGVFTGDWSKAWDGIKMIFQGFVDILSGILNGLIDIFQSVWEGIKNIVKAAVDIIITIWNTFADTCKTVWNAIATFLKGVWEGIKSVASTVWNAIKDAITGVVEAIKTVVTNVWNSIKDALTTVMNAIKTVITTVWNSIKEAITTVINAIKSVLESVWNAIKTAITNTMNAIKSVVESVWNAIKSAVTTIVNGIKSTVTSVWDSLKNAVTNTINALKSTITSVWNAISSTMSSVANGIKNTVTNAWEGLKYGVMNTMDNLSNAIRGPINSIIGFINGMVRGIVSGVNAVINTLNRLNIEIPDWVPGIGGNSFGFNIPNISAPQIPMLAKGGVITQPTVAMMGEYAGASSNPEIVTPQSILRETINEGNVTLVEALYQMCTQVIDAINSQNIEVSIGDDVIASSAARGNNAYKQRTGMPLFA